MSDPSPRVAVVTLAHGRHEHLAAQMTALGRSTRTPDLYVVAAVGDPGIAALVATADAHDRRPAGRSIVLDIPLDAATGELPLARARNAAAGAAVEAGAEVLVFLDVDCLPHPALVVTYADACASAPPSSAGTPQVSCGPVHYLPPRRDGAAGYAEDELRGSVPHPARPAPQAGEQVEADDLMLFWSLSFALTATAWKALGGFDEGYVGYGGEDTDFALVLSRAGGRLWWLGGAVAYHQHHEVESPPRRHLDAIVRNSNRFHDRWGFFPMTGWLDAFEADGLVRLVRPAGSPPRWERTPDAGRSVRSP